MKIEIKKITSNDLLDVITFLFFLFPFLKIREELFSLMRCKIYDHHPHDQMSLLAVVKMGYVNTSVEARSNRKHN